MRMALSHVLLVDDSEVILTFERAALSGHYTVSSASNGREALEQLKRARPAAMLLDLSMPEMGGVEVLRTLRDDPGLADLPVIIVSSEDHRRDECLQAGADEFLPKPVRAPDLLAAVNRVIAARQARAMHDGLAVLFVQVGELEFGVPLEFVDQVLSESATIPLAAGPPHLCELVDLHGKSVLVLDTAARLGTQYRRPAADRVFVVLDHAGRQFCLRADGVRDPEEIPSDRLEQSADLGGSKAVGVRALLRAIVRTDHGPVPILEAMGLVAGETVDGLQDLMAGGEVQGSP
jgi:CheY-like chemotaxis protein/chemotaxis signal transduction protein